MNKIFGYVLICAGLMLILFALTGMYKVFVDGAAAAPIIQLADLQLNTAYGPVIVPMKSASQVANLGLFAIFMVFVVSAGGKIAGIGNGLVKNERIYEALSANPAAAKDPDSLKNL